MSTKQIAGSSRSRWTRLFDDSTATTALAIPLPSNTVPTGTGLLSTGEFPLARFIISGTVATGTINYQIIGWQRFTQTGGTGAPTAWIPRVLASGVATLGTAAVTATWIGTATDVFAHTITETTGATGSVIFSPGGNKIAWVEIDCSNCELLEVETDLETATAASVIYQLGDRVGGLMDIDASIAGTGLATSALQTTGNTSLGTIKTNTDVLVAAGGGGYIRQDSTATLAKESGGNLASVKTNTDKIPALGTAVMTASAPVTIATDDTVLLAMKKATIGAAAPTIDSYTSDDINCAANTANQSIVAAPGANKQIWVYGFGGTANAAGSVSVQDEDDTAISGVMPVGANGGPPAISPSGNFAMPAWKVATNKALEIDTVTCEFDGWISYAIVSV